MDTVIIKIYGPHNKFKVRDRSQFVPELNTRKYEELSDMEKASPVNRPYLRHFIMRPKAMHEFREEYIPRVEIFESLTEDRKDIRYILKIEFSAPKLLFWNSLQEVGENDKQRVCLCLKSILENLGVVVSVEQIENAIVSAVHACKNIPLPKTIRMREVIKELVKIDISKAFDISHKQDKKGARILNIHSGTIDWSIYDKVSDSLRPKNKRSDKKRIDRERAVIEQYNLQDREVFRYEYRIKKTQTIKRDVNKLLNRDPKTQVIFSDLFTPNLLKTMVLNSWHSIIERPENQLSLFGETDTLKLLLHILSEASKGGKKAHSLDNALISYGLVTAIRDHGAKEVKGAIFDIWNKDHPERLKKKIELASKLTAEIPYSNNIDFIDKELEKFELINLASLEKGI